MAEAGARLAIRLLQDAAERGDLDPWDVDVIAVVDGFLDQLRARIEVPRLVAAQAGEGGGSYEQDLAATSEAFLAASVLVGLKAEVLERQTFPPPPLGEDDLDGEAQDLESWALAGFEMPRRPERHLWRRPVAPPPLQRPVTLGELIRQLEDIAERIEQGETTRRPKPRGRAYSEHAAIEQVAALAHREKLPETTAALRVFLSDWPRAESWVDFDALVSDWEQAAAADLDQDRVGVFWALLFLCSQGQVDLLQDGGLHGPLRIRRVGQDAEAAGQASSLRAQPALVPAPLPAREAMAA